MEMLQKLYLMNMVVYFVTFICLSIRILFPKTVDNDTLFNTYLYSLCVGTILLAMNASRIKEVLKCHPQNSIFMHRLSRHFKILFNPMLAVCVGLCGCPFRFLLFYFLWEGNHSIIF